MTSGHSPLAIARTVAALRKTIAGWRRAGETVALAPTMGALHEGHLSLVELARRHADRVVVSIFVNPTQFGPSEDFSRYPRRETEDGRMLADAGAHLLYSPSVDEMYPGGFSTSVSVGPLARDLCGAFRPGHFDGVATVVAKLLNQARPDAAIFGEKDYQQLLVIRRMVADLDFPVRILGAPLLRDADGLALSSRNAYLTASQRALALALPRVLAHTARRAGEAGSDPVALAADAARQLQDAGFDAIDYVEIRDRETLAPLSDLTRPARILAAVRLGGTRLIDNMEI